MSHDGNTPPGPPSLTPLRGYGGNAKREASIYDEVIGGPLKAIVRVVPITGLSLGTRFELVADWRGRGIPGTTPDRTRADLPCTDRYNLDPGYRELALAAARATAELLREGQVPFLRDVVTAVKLHAGGWRAWYDDKIGDDWRPWAP